MTTPMMIGACPCQSVAMMAAKVTKRLWESGDIVDVLEAWEAAS